MGRRLTRSDLLALEADHTPAAVAVRMAADCAHGYLRDFVYGSIDGCVTTFAIISVVVGAQLSGRVIVILGLANLLADGFSMAVSNFLGTKTERQVVHRARAIEEMHVDEIPGGEEEEIREIFRQKGFKGELLEQVVEVVTNDRKLWIETMLKEEWGLSLHGSSPVKAALITFAAFVCLGFIPLLPFILFYSWDGASVGCFYASCALTGLAFFGIGGLKSVLATENWFRSGSETLLMGGGAALLAFLVGTLLKGLG